MRSRTAIGGLVLLVMAGAVAQARSPSLLPDPALPSGQQAAGWRARGIAAFDTVWRTINETYFDPTFGGLDWDAVGRELRPRVEAATSADRQRAIISDMLSRLGQSHLALLSGRNSEITPRGPAVPPIDVRVSGETLIVTRVWAEGGALDGVRAGDRIRAIDGTDAAALVAAGAEDGAPGSQMAWRRAMAVLSGAVGSPVRLGLEAPDGARREVSVVRRLPPGELVQLGNLPPTRVHLEATSRLTPDGRTVGVVRFNVWLPSLANQFADAIDTFRTADGLVIDLRGNPGGLAEMMRGIAGHVLDEPALLGRMRMRDLTLEFRANPRRSTRDGKVVRPYAGPVAILVDELTVSASECFAGGLQALGRARIFGRRTAGQALPATTKRLENGDVLLYAVGDFVTGTGQRIEGIGVIPDEEIPIDPARLAAGFDAETAAIAWIGGSTK